jgi:hypothetical protein
MNAERRRLPNRRQSETLRDVRGRPSTPIGVALDLLAAQENSP